MTGLNSFVKKSEGDDQEDLFEGIDIDLPDDVDEVMKPSALSNIIATGDEGDTPPPGVLEKIEADGKKANYVGDFNGNDTKIDFNDNSFEEYIQNVLQHGADKGVVNVVLGHCENGMSKNHGRLIISGAMQYGFGKTEALELCTASLTGLEDNELKNLISQFQPTNKSLSRGGISSAGLIKSVFSGFSGLFNKQKNTDFTNDISSRSFDKALEKVRNSAYEICKTSHSHNIAAAKDSISSPDDLKKMVGNLKVDDASKGYIDDYRVKVELLKKEAKLLLGKAKTKEQAEKIHSKISDELQNLNTEFKDKLEFINDSARSPIAEFLDELGKEVDKMFKQIMERFGIRAKKSEKDEGIHTPESQATPSPSAS